MVRSAAAPGVNHAYQQNLLKHHAVYGAQFVCMVISACVVPLTPLAAAGRSPRKSVGPSSRARASY